MRINSNFPNASKMIENKGRGQKFFSKEEVEKKNNELFVNSFEWLTLTLNKAYNYMTKNIDINGNIYLITPEEQMIPTDIQLNYFNKNKQTAPIHSDIKFFPLIFKRKDKKNANITN